MTRQHISQKYMPLIQSPGVVEFALIN